MDLIQQQSDTARKYRTNPITHKKVRFDHYDSNQDESVVEDPSPYQSNHTSDSERHQFKELFTSNNLDSNRDHYDKPHFHQQFELNEELKEFLKLKHEADKLHKQGNGRNHIILSKARQIYLKTYHSTHEKHYENEQEQHVLMNLKKGCLIFSISISNKLEQFEEGIELCKILEQDVGFKDQTQKDQHHYRLGQLYQKSGKLKQSLEEMYKIKEKNEKIKKEIQRIEYQITQQQLSDKRKAQLKASFIGESGSGSDSLASSIMYSQLPISNLKLNEEEAKQLATQLGYEKETAENGVPEKSRNNSSSLANYSKLAGSFALMATGLVLYKYFK